MRRRFLQLEIGTFTVEMNELKTTASFCPNHGNFEQKCLSTPSFLKVGRLREKTRPQLRPVSSQNLGWFLGQTKRFQKARMPCSKVGGHSTKKLICSAPILWFHSVFRCPHPHLSFWEKRNIIKIKIIIFKFITASFIN